MEEINLEKYKSEWNTEQGFFEEKLSRDQIAKFMQLKSKNICSLFKRSLIVDLLIKIILLLSFGVLMVLYSNQYRLLLINTIFILLIILGIIIQVGVYNKIPYMKNTAQNIKALLYSYIDFYKRKFILSLIITSFSSSLIFINGALYYFYYRYGTIRSFQYNDYLVFGILIIFSFLLSIFIQTKNFNFHLRQLKNTLADIEQKTINENKLKHYKHINKRNLIIYSAILFVGILLLLFLFVF